MLTVTVVPFPLNAINFEGSLQGICPFTHARQSNRRMVYDLFFCNASPVIPDFHSESISRILQDYRNLLRLCMAGNVGNPAEFGRQTHHGGQR